MNINEAISKKGITKYRLSKSSGVPYTTISDISSGKSRIEKCSGETLYRIAKALDVSIEHLLESAMNLNTEAEYRMPFENFKSDICHRVKDMGDVAFIDSLVESDKIRLLFERGWHLESLYLLAMVDYLCRENNIPINTTYKDIRAAKLSEPIYPSSIIALSLALDDEDIKKQSLAESIPEFLRFNIVENEVRNVI